MSKHSGSRSMAKLAAISCGAILSVCALLAGAMWLWWPQPATSGDDHAFGPAVALSFALAGAALVLDCSRWHRFARLLGALLAALAVLLTLLTWGGLTIAASGHTAGMPLLLGLAFVAAGLTLALPEGARTRSLALAPAGLVGGIAVLSLLDHVFRTHPAATLDVHTIPVSPCVALLVLAAGLLLRRPASWPVIGLRVALAMLMLGALLPALILIFLQAERSAAERMSTLEREAHANAVQGAILIDRLVAERMTLLKGLATSPALRSGDLAAFHRQALEVVPIAEGDIVVLDHALNIRLSTARPFGTPLPRPVETASAMRVIETGTEQISDYFVGSVTRRASVAISVPVPQTELILRVALPCTWISSQLGRIERQGALLGATDRKGIIVGRSDGGEQWVGRAASRKAWDVSRASPSGWAEVESADGHPVYAAWRHLAFGWTVFVGIGQATVAGEEGMRARRLSLGTALVTLLALFLATFGSVAVGRPLARLAAAAEALGRGSLPTLPSAGLRELDTVGAALMEAAAARHTAESALRQSEERLRAIIDTAADAIVVIDDTGRIQSINDAGARMFGYARAEMDGHNVSMLMPEPHRSAHDGYIARHLATGHTGIIGTGREVDARRQDGTTFPADLSVVAWTAGGQRFFTGMLRDATERKRREDQVQLLLREVNHRAKNLLGVVQVIARQTAAETREDFIARFSDRIQALAASHDLLVRSEWHGISMTELAEAQLAHLRDLVGNRISLEGPDVRITAHAAQPLAMALHELSTNAGKYGALSNREGSVRVAWQIVSTPAGDRFRIGWTETGGPPVHPPSLRGFGSVVIEQMPRMQLRADVALDFSAAGVEWRLECPAANVVETAPAPGATPRQT